MRIVISGRASVYSDGLPCNPAAVTDPAVLRALDGYDAQPDDLANDLDGSLTRAGVSGGTLRFAYLPEGNNLRVVSEYHCARSLGDDELARLVRETKGSWSDGVGENGFEVEWEGCSGLVYPYPAGFPGGHVDQDVQVEQSPD